MTRAEVLERARQLAAAARPGAVRVAGWVWDHLSLVLAVAVVLLVALNLRACGRASTAERELAAANARAADESKAETSGIPVAREVSQADIEARLAAALSENAEWKRVHERDQKAMGKLRAELVAVIRADPGPALVPVAKGAPLRLGADLAVNETKAGAHLIEGTLEAWSGADLVLRQPFSQPATVAAVTRPPPAPAAAAPERRLRWGPAGGVAGGPGGGGWIVGGAATYRVWKLHLVLAGGAGTGGAAALAGVLF